MLGSEVLNSPTGPEAILLLEFCPGGHLLELLIQRSGQLLGEQIICKFFGQLLFAMRSLHEYSTPIIHRDLKLENILVGQDGNIRLCDFGSCSIGYVNVRNANERAAAEESIAKETTQMYRAPEMIDLYMRDILTEKTDIWALGCILYAMCFLIHPFQDAGSLGVLNWSPTLIPKNDAVKREFKVLIVRTLDMDPEARPSISQLIIAINAISSGDALPSYDIPQEAKNRRMEREKIEKIREQKKNAKKHSTYNTVIKKKDGSNDSLPADSVAARRLAAKRGMVPASLPAELNFDTFSDTPESQEDQKFRGNSFSDDLSFLQIPYAASQAPKVNTQPKVVSDVFPSDKNSTATFSDFENFNSTSSFQPFGASNTTDAFDNKPFASPFYETTRKDGAFDADVFSKNGNQDFTEPFSQFSLDSPSQVPQFNDFFSGNKTTIVGDVGLSSVSFSAFVSDDNFNDNLSSEGITDKSWDSTAFSAIPSVEFPIDAFPTKEDSFDPFGGSNNNWNTTAMDNKQQISFGSTSYATKYKSGPVNPFGDLGVVSIPKEPKAESMRSMSGNLINKGAQRIVQSMTPHSNAPHSINSGCINTKQSDFDLFDTSSVIGSNNIDTDLLSHINILAEQQPKRKSKQDNISKSENILNLFDAQTSEVLTPQLLTPQAASQPSLLMPQGPPSASKIIKSMAISNIFDNMSPRQMNPQMIQTNGVFQIGGPPSMQKQMPQPQLDVSFNLNSFSGGIAPVNPFALSPLSSNISTYKSSSSQYTSQKSAPLDPFAEFSIHRK